MAPVMYVSLAKSMLDILVLSIKKILQNDSPSELPSKTASRKASSSTSPNLNAYSKARFRHFVTDLLEENSLPMNVPINRSITPKFQVAFKIDSAVRRSNSSINEHIFSEDDWEEESDIDGEENEMKHNWFNKRKKRKYVKNKKDQTYYSIFSLEI